MFAKPTISRQARWHKKKKHNAAIKATSKSNNDHDSPGSPVGAGGTAATSDDVESVAVVAVVAASGAAGGCSDAGVSAGVAFAAGVAGVEVPSSSPARFSPGEMRSCQTVKISEGSSLASSL